MGRNSLQEETLSVIAAKSGTGFLGSFAAMTVNDIAGLVVAALTGIYMCFQIEAAYQRRKARKKNELPD